MVVVAAGPRKYVERHPKLSEENTQQKKRPAAPNCNVYPLYILSILFVWLASGSTVDLIVYFLALQAWSANLAVAYGLNSPAWSISVEFFLYAVFPVLATILFKTISIKGEFYIIAAAGFVVVAMFSISTAFYFAGYADLPWTDPRSAHRWLYRTPLLRIGDFVLGMLAAFYFIKCAHRPDSTRLRYLQASAIGGFFIVIALMCSKSMLYSSWSWDIAYALPMTLIILGTAYSGNTLWGRMLSSRAMLLLGNASFAFYLIHLNVMLPLYTPPEPPLKKALFYALFLGISSAAAIGLHLKVELPLRSFFTRLLTRSISPPSRTETQSSS